MSRAPARCFGVQLPRQITTLFPITSPQTRRADPYYGYPTHVTARSDHRIVRFPARPRHESLVEREPGSSLSSCIARLLVASLRSTPDCCLVLDIHPLIDEHKNAKAVHGIRRLAVSRRRWAKRTRRGGNPTSQESSRLQKKQCHDPCFCAGGSHPEHYERILKIK